MKREFQHNGKLKLLISVVDKMADGKGNYEISTGWDMMNALFFVGVYSCFVRKQNEILGSMKVDNETAGCD